MQTAIKITGNKFCRLNKSFEKKKKKKMDLYVSIPGPILLFSFFQVQVSRLLIHSGTNKTSMVYKELISKNINIFISYVTRVSRVDSFFFLILFLFVSLHAEFN